jgi:hypothetical protein
MSFVSQLGGLLYDVAISNVLFNCGSTLTAECEPETTSNCSMCMALLLSHIFIRQLPSLTNFVSFFPEVQKPLNSKVIRLTPGSGHPNICYVLPLPYELSSFTLLN